MSTIYPCRYIYILFTIHFVMLQHHILACYNRFEEIVVKNCVVAAQIGLRRFKFFICTKSSPESGLYPSVSEIITFVNHHIVKIFVVLKVCFLNGIDWVSESRVCFVQRTSKAGK